MHIIWSERAFVRRQAIEDYILYSFGFAAHDKYVEEIASWKEVLLANPNAGIIEPILIGMRKNYRSIAVGKLTKCIYYVENDTIVIADWWDTRRKVAKLKSGL